MIGRQTARTHSTPTRWHERACKRKKCATDNYALKIEIYCFRFGRWAIVEYINAIKYVSSDETIPQNYSISNVNRNGAVVRGRRRRGLGAAETVCQTKI